MVFEKIAQLIAEQFSVEVESITMEMSFEDLGADSLDIVELSMALEEEFDVGEMGDDDLSGVATVGDLVRHISEKLGD
jgi:acyl carrier protein